MATLGKVMIDIGKGEVIIGRIGKDEVLRIAWIYSIYLFFFSVKLFEKCSSKILKEKLSG